MEQNDLDKVIKGRPNADIDDDFMALMSDYFRARRPVSPEDKKRYEEIKQARKEELKLQGQAFKLEKEGKLNMDLKEHFKRRMSNLLNEVSVKQSMKIATRKGKSPLVAAAKTLAHNIKLRGIRGIISPSDYIARTAWALQKSSELGRGNPDYYYKSPNPLLRAFDSYRRSPWGTFTLAGRGEGRPEGDSYEEAWRVTGGRSGVQDVKALRDRYLSFYNEKWPRRQTRRITVEPPSERRQVPAPRPEIPPQTTSILDINRSILPARGMPEVPVREPPKQDTARPLDILDINRSGRNTSSNIGHVADQIAINLLKRFIGPQVRSRSGGNQGPIPGPRVITTGNPGPRERRGEGRRPLF